MKKISKLLTITSGLLIFYGCKEKEQPPKAKNYDEIPNYVKVNNDKVKTDSLFAVALNNGDEKAYNDVSANYILASNYKELFYYSIIMANKYDLPEAHYHIFVALINSSPKQNLNLMDEKTKNLALYHLAKSHELGFASAKYSISELFGKNGKIQNSKYYIRAYFN
ncbi:hypothetical protein [Flavobacterium silvaticum]|uniref:Lipoprotein n=1 Tax=Flavobacterium silvaticum TaxID=1852020 RepID=A0A972FR53_9FLAO|nr:hypothetical protein [Flavobacterium silvaticum]NMH26467.1 hypothetical protein [Flavobacterium silvaticum]